MLAIFWFPSSAKNGDFRCLEGTFSWFLVLFCGFCDFGSLGAKKEAKLYQLLKQITSFWESFSVLLRPCVLLVFQVFFWRSLFGTFCDFGVLRGSKIDAFWVNLDHICVLRWICENGVLARVSARFGRSRSLPKSDIFDVLWGVGFRCVFRTLFFRVLSIFGSIWRSLVPNFGTFWWHFGVWDRRWRMRRFWAGAGGRGGSPGVLKLVSSNS